jgi:8-oxo-dGTP pyrophosphatase MutT (NUDIX family)
MELWDIYDQCFIKTGRVHERGKPLSRGDYHLVVHIYPVNSRGELLIQKRAENISWKPGFWAVTGGSAVAGEDAWTACRRELMEELGIEATRDNTSLVLMNRRYDNFMTLWVVKTDIRLSELKLQPEEVADAMWATPQEIRTMMAEGIFVEYNYLEYLFQYIKNESRNQMKTDVV